MLLVIRNPAIMLPIVRRLIGFSRAGLFSLMFVRAGKRGCPVRVRRIVRVVYAPVKEVAIIVMNRAQALVYDVFVASIMRSLE